MINPGDLQLNDYVSVNDNIEKVCVLSEDFISTEIYSELIPEEVNPIYLTDEFLQKNGFEKYFTYRKSWFREESVKNVDEIPTGTENIKVHWRKQVIDLCKYFKDTSNRMTFTYWENSHIIQYVHELQHLMRLYTNKDVQY